MHPIRFLFVAVLWFALVAVGAACPGSRGAPDAGPCHDSGGDAPACTGPACLPGSFPVCEPQAHPVACCRAGAAPGDPFGEGACAMEAGVLVHHTDAGDSLCPPSCASDLCAVSGGGVVTCCDFGANPNPCATPTP